MTEESEKEKFVNRFTPILVAVYHIFLQSLFWEVGLIQ